MLGLIPSERLRIFTRLSFFLSVLCQVVHMSLPALFKATMPTTVMVKDDNWDAVCLHAPHISPNPSSSTTFSEFFSNLAEGGCQACEFVLCEYDSRSYTVFGSSWVGQQ